MGETGSVSRDDATSPEAIPEPGCPARAATTHVAVAALLLPGLAWLCGCSHPLLLDAPLVAPSHAREPTPLDLEPIADGAHVEGDFAPPGPAAVLTAAMKAELAGRALRGGEPGGYAVRCRLDRFAVRLRATMTESREMVALYADLSCEGRRNPDGAIVWRGELRGRTCASGPNVLGSDANTQRRLTDRALSDVAREMASDLAVRGLALAAEPSARVFVDEAQQRELSGLDDSPYGPAALAENEAAVQGALRALGEHDAPTRAAAWNVAALAAGPGDPWLGGDQLRLDEDPLVRFVQYKALARLGTQTALSQLGATVDKEDHPLLAEFLRDALASHGIGLARSRR
jgi:hypothetical protein